MWALIVVRRNDGGAACGRDTRPDTVSASPLAAITGFAGLARREARRPITPSQSTLLIMLVY
jgi:hypothetical protein